MPPPRLADGIGQVADHYDAFVFDQWGVLHDGRKLYDGVLDVFYQLSRTAKPVVILTNSRKRESDNVVRLERFGITPDLYTGLVSSAEVLRELLDLKPFSPWDTVGDKAYVVALDEDACLLNGTRCEQVGDIGTADFVLLLSTANRMTLADHDHWLRPAASRGLCAFSSSAEPLTINSAGVFLGLADVVQAYESCGGTVLNVGKPNALVYEQCARLLPGVDPARVLAVGDQFEADVVGAKAYGFDAAMVRTGAAELAYADCGTLEQAAKAIAAAGAGEVACDWLLPSLRWGPESEPAESP